MTTPPLWLTEAEVTGLMSLPEAITALEQGLVAEAHAAAANMEKTHVGWGDGHTLHAIGAAFAAAGFVGTKTWAHTAGGATPLLILFDSHTGSLKAIIEAFALGQLRTGGISGVATRWLAPADAHTLALVGTGKQALSQVAAVVAVRPITSVRIFSPNPDHRATFAVRVREELAVDAVDCASVADAVAGAAIITLVTRATRSFLSAEMIAPGSHINAVGAITPERAEVEPDIFARCSRIVADSVPAARHLSREFIDALSTTDWSRVTPLSRVVAEQQGRPPGADLTLFKAMGMGISDLAVGIELYQRALTAGVGRPLDAPQRARVRLRP